jgi:hypothetical protein
MWLLHKTTTYTAVPTRHKGPHDLVMLKVFRLEGILGDGTTTGQLAYSDP